MIDRIYIKEASLKVGYKDLRAFRKWCERFCLKIHQDFGSKKQFLNKYEFEEAANRTLYEYKAIKSTEEITAQINFESQKRKAIDDRNIKSTKTSYRPQFENELRWLSTLTFNHNKNNNVK